MSTEHPSQGGSYQRDPVTGALTLIERTDTSSGAGLRSHAVEQQAATADAAETAEAATTPAAAGDNIREA